jgi:hypothetical protein
MARHRLKVKGPLWKKLCTLCTKTELNAHTIKVNTHLEIKFLIYTAKSQYLPHRLALWDSRPLVVRVVLLDGDHVAVVAVDETAVLHNHLLQVVWSGMLVPKAACQM